MQPLALGAAALAFRVPQENGAKKEIHKMSYLYVKWNSFGRDLLASGLAIKACRASLWPLQERRPAMP